MKKVLLLTTLTLLVLVQSAFAISSAEYRKMGKWLIGSEINPSGTYGQVHSAWTGIYPGSKHPGVDYPVTLKSVKAVCDGEVTSTGGNLGIVAIYNKNVNKTYIYLHLSSVRVRAGNKVKKGDTIGVSGKKAPYSIPYHLHFEVRNGKRTAAAPSFAESVDPYYWSNRAR